MRPRGRLRNRSGQALVEFALVLPILMILTFAIIDFGRAWSASHALADAAREGLRIVVVKDASQGIPEAEAAIAARLAPLGISLAADQITWTTVDGTGTEVALTGEPTRGDPVTVTLTHDFQYLIIGRLLDWAAGAENVDLQSSYTMRAE